MSTLAPCWSQDEVLRIVTPDAEEISDHVFRAVHCPTDLQIADTWNGPRSSQNPERLVERFLEEGRRYVQAVILGESGTGKSHLIQWLRLHLPARAEDMVLVIPKVGTSLRGIVQRIVNRLPEESRGPFEEKLKTAGAQTTTHEARIDKFLFSLAWSVRYAVPDLSGEDADLAEMLPDVLADPSFRLGFFNRPGGSVDQIVRHIFDHPEGREVQTSRRQFQRGDLPLGGEHYRDAALRARDAIDFIRGESGMEQRAIDLMTRALEPAIAQTLNFTADDLIDLMRSLRVHLAQEGKRLILLIEDFARLQGIDTALLQALVTPPRQEEQQLCELRWAMAVTTGYFRTRFDETVRTRATFVVDMDRSQPASISQFAAGYLNAIRVGESALRATSADAELPIRCRDCERREPCWEAFGQQDGIGLFPFNATALHSFAERTHALQDGGFNPRTFLSAVLDPVMRQHYADFVQHRFPSSSLLARVGGENRLRPQAVAELERLDPLLAPRRVAMLELWDGNGKVVNLRPGIHEAFGIPPIPNIGTVESEVGGGATEVDDSKPEPPSESPLITALHNWATRDGSLSQAQVQTLRNLVHHALDGFIDWDAFGIQKTYVTSAFRLTSINFVRQQTARNRTAVSLELPLPGQSIAQTAVVLEALARGSEALAWDHDDGCAQMAAVLEDLSVWAEAATEQLRQVFGSRDQWDPITASVEMLTLGLLQSGKVKVNDSAETVARKLFDRAPTPMVALTHPFQQQCNRLVQSYDDTRFVLRALCSGTKGGRTGNFTRITPVVHSIRALRRRNLHLALVPPGEVGVQDLRPLVDGYGRLANEYQTAFDGERAAWNVWLQRTHLSLGPGRRPSEFLGLVQSILSDVENIGLDIGNVRDALRTVLGELPSTQALNHALDHVAAVNDAAAGEALVRAALASAHRAALDQLITSAETAVNRIEARVQGELDQIDVDVGAGLAASKAAIASALADSVTAIACLEAVKEQT